MNSVAVKLLIALAIISTFVGVNAKPQIEISPAPVMCQGGPHDIFRTCGTSCPSTCENPNPQMCTMNCILNVCQCDEGYARAPDGNCILPGDCPK